MEASNVEGTTMVSPLSSERTRPGQARCMEELLLLSKVTPE
jgi:hypothetical protein